MHTLTFMKSSKETGSRTRAHSQGSSEAGLAQRLIQIGIRTANAHQRAQAVRYGVETIEARNWTGIPAVEWAVYISVDIDVLDPAFAAWSVASRTWRIEHARVD